MTDATTPPPELPGSTPTTDPPDPTGPVGAPPPEAAAHVFGRAYAGALRYAELLRTLGVERGLVGPRETDRLWERHLLNSAVLAELVPTGTRVVDVGSGAGLPGLPLALARPDLEVVLVEPMARRCAFLDLCVRELGLDRVRVVRGRAAEVGEYAAPVVTARAVAPLERLVPWTVPLVDTASGPGCILAVKGARAAEELTAWGAVEAGDDRWTAPAALRRRGVEDVRVVRAGCGIIDPPVTVVRLVVGRTSRGGRGRR